MEDGSRSSEEAQQPAESQLQDNGKASGAKEKEALDLVKSPCKALAAKRKELGWTEEEVASRLKMTVRQIQAMESGDFDAFHGVTFARAFVRAYARLMGLDPTPLVAFFAKGDGAPPPKNIRNPVVPESLGQTFGDTQMTFRERSNVGCIIWILVALVVVVVIGVAWYMKYIPWHRPTPKASPVVEQKAPEQQPAPQQPVASSEPVAASAEPAKDTAVPEGKAPLKMTFTADSWIQIQKEDGKTTIAQFVAKAGETKQMDIEVPAVIVVGNTKGVSMEFRNAAVDLNAVAKGNTAKLTLK